MSFFFLFFFSFHLFCSVFLFCIFLVGACPPDWSKVQDVQGQIIIQCIWCVDSIFSPFSVFHDSLCPTSGRGGAETIWATVATLSCLEASPGAALLSIKSLTELEREVWANSLSFNLSETELMLKKECAGTYITWGNEDFFSQWLCFHRALAAQECVHYPTSKLSEVWPDRRCLPNF